MRAAGQALYAASFRLPRSIRRLALDTKRRAEELEGRPFTSRREPAANGSQKTARRKDNPRGLRARWRSCAKAQRRRARARGGIWHRSRAADRFVLERRNLALARHLASPLTHVRQSRCGLADWPASRATGLLVFGPDRAAHRPVAARATRAAA